MRYKEGTLKRTKSLEETSCALHIHIKYNFKVELFF